MVLLLLGNFLCVWEGFDCSGLLVVVHLFLIISVTHDLDRQSQS